MGLFSSIGAVLGTAIGGPVGGTIGSTAGGFLDDNTGNIISGVSAYGQYKGAQDQNEANERIAEKQMSFQERMSNTAYQRAVADMKAAGINPMVAYQQGGASAPSGAGIAAVNTLEGAASTSLHARRISAEIDNMDELNKNLRESNKQTQSQVDLNKAATTKQQAETLLTSQLTKKAGMDTASSALQAKLLAERIPAAENASAVDRSLYGKGAAYVDRFFSSIGNIFGSSAKAIPFIK